MTSVAEAGGGGRVVATRALGPLALLVVWFALVFPDQLGRFTPDAWVRLPVEGLLLVALALLLPPAAGRVLATVAGVVLGLLAVLKIVDLGFFAVMGQPFHPGTDWSYLRSAIGLLQDTAGLALTVVVVILVVGALSGVLLLVTWSVRRLTRVANEHQAISTGTTSALALVWLLCSALGLQVAGAPIATTAGAGFTPVRSSPAPARGSGSLAGDDPFARTAPGDLLTGLQGKDVLLVFVESYGRVALEDPAISPGVHRVLDASTESLHAAGFSSRSALLTSPTFAGLSWLAHSTLQSGRWVDTKQRYDQLLRIDRLTLSAAFHRAGWRTVDVVPSNTEDWPEGQAFYGYDQIYDQRNVGYAGPSFSYAAMPDQYTLAALQRAELAPAHRGPVMAEVDLASSHGPWAPLPRMVDWGAVGDGSIFDAMPGQGESPRDLAGRPARTKAAYAKSIEYSLTALTSFVQTYPSDNLVLVVVGDHQPAPVVSGIGASHDVPISIIARDPAVLARIDGWGWAPGMLPRPDAPVWPMDAFRDRFLTAYGSQPTTTPAAPR
jgi:hypothetical protein